MSDQYSWSKTPQSKRMQSAYNAGAKAQQKKAPMRSKVNTTVRNIKMNSTNQQALRVGGWANPSVGGEVKFTDVSVALATPIALATWTAPQLLNGLANGSDASTRIGRKVTLKSVLVRASVALAPTSVGGSPIRILVVYDKQANATAPAVTDILLADAFTSQNNLSNRDRFVTIFDQVTTPVSVQNNFSNEHTMFKRINMETMFNAGSAGTVGDITSGSVYLLFCQNSGISVAAPTMIYRTRVRYTDV